MDVIKKFRKKLVEKKTFSMDCRRFKNTWTFSFVKLRLMHVGTVNEANKYGRYCI